MMNNNIFKGWKTTTIGIILLLVNLYYFLTTEMVNTIALIFVAILSLILMFIPDTLFNSLKKLIKNNEDKKL